MVKKSDYDDLNDELNKGVNSVYKKGELWVDFIIIPSSTPTGP